MDRGWSYPSVEDLRSTERMRQEIQQLRTRVYHYELQMRGRGSLTDTTAAPALEAVPDRRNPGAGR